MSIELALLAKGVNTEMIMMMTTMEHVSYLNESTVSECMEIALLAETVT